MHIFWDVTRHCNLKCKHCYNAIDRLCGHEDSNLDVQLDTISKLSEIYPGATLHLLGGEPLISPSFYEIVSSASLYGFKIEVTTNGTILSNDLISMLIEKCTHVHLSLDSVDPELNDFIRGQGVFNKIKKFIDLWNRLFDFKNQKSCLNLSYTLTKLTLGEYSQIIDFCISNKIPSLTIAPIKLLDEVYKLKELALTCSEYFYYTESIAKRYLGEDLKLRMLNGSMLFKNYIKRKYYSDIVFVESYCNAATKQLRITWDCKIYPCIMACHKNKYNKENFNIEYDVTSIKDKSFEDFLNYIQNRLLRIRPEICSNCVFFHAHKCIPGCPIQAEFGPAGLCLELIKKEGAHNVKNYR